jgi:transcriptional regulator with XRE-family HTH domain
MPRKISRAPSTSAPAPTGRRQRRAAGNVAQARDAQETGAATRVDVGSALRRLREERDLTIRVLAKQSGLAINTLSLIENSKTSPSVSTLQALALALEVPITAFFETDAPKITIAHLKVGQRPQAAFAHGTLEDLGAGLSERTVEPFVVTLEPGAGSGPHPIVHTGEEFLYCLEGRIAYVIEERTYLLEPGDSLLFASHLPHRWQNVDAGPSRAILVLCPADVRDRPTERHFAQP